MTVTVRPATEADLPAIADIGHRTWPATYEPFTGPEYVAEGLAKWWSEEALRRGLPNTLVAEDETGTVIGMTSFAQGSEALIIWKLYVLPTAQGKGAGKALLHSVITNATTGNEPVHLEYLEGNTQAAAFYAHQGFVFLRQEPNATGPDSVWLERRPEP